MEGVKGIRGTCVDHDHAATCFLDGAGASEAVDDVAVVHLASALSPCFKVKGSGFVV
jgi:hypothetical protein